VTNTNTGTANLLSGSNAVKIYPVPNTGNFTVSGVKTGEVIEIYNCTGQKLISRLADNNPTMQFDISGRASGIYFIRILNKDGTSVTEQKILKTE
jgi:hypothetical protein